MKKILWILSLTVLVSVGAFAEGERVTMSATKLQDGRLQVTAPKTGRYTIQHIDANGTKIPYGSVHVVQDAAAATKGVYFVSENMGDFSYWVGAGTKEWTFKNGGVALSGVKAVQVASKTGAGLGLPTSSPYREISIGTVAAGETFTVSTAIDVSHTVGTPLKSSYWKLVDGSGEDIEMLNNSTDECWIKLVSNQNPVFSSLQPDNIGGNSSETIAFDLFGDDEEDDALTYSVTSGGGSIGYNSTLGRYYWTGSFSTVNANGWQVYPVVVKVSDSYGGSSEKTFNVVVVQGGQLQNFFNDVTYTSTALNNSYACITYMVLCGVLIGYDDPANPGERQFIGDADDGSYVNQAEALKMIVKAAQFRGLISMDVALRDLPNLIKYNTGTGDFRNYEWAAPYVLKAEAVGAIDDAATLDPEAHVTRAWLAHVIRTLLNLSVPESVVNPAGTQFTDAGSFATDESYADARACAFYGIMGSFGYPFSPSEDVPRRDAAIYASKIVRFPTATGLQYGGDVDTSSGSPAVFCGDSFTITNVTGLMSHRYVQTGAQISESGIGTAKEYVGIKVVCEGLGSVGGAGDFLVENLPANPITVDCSSFDVAQTTSTNLYAVFYDTNSHVSSIMTIPLTLRPADDDGDGVKNSLDVWRGVPGYSLDANGNGIPDEADVLYSTAARQGSEKVVINGTTNTAVDWVLGGRGAWLTLSQYPADTLAKIGSTVSFRVASRASAASYRWYRNGVALSDGGAFSGTTGSQLNIVTAAGTEGIYTVRVTDGDLMFDSNTAMLTLYDDATPTPTVTVTPSTTPTVTSTPTPVSTPTPGPSPTAQPTSSSGNASSGWMLLLLNE
ncbi:MAG: hypothetical protein EOL87_11255 [Spartobacteria bacterium]|nr:hypothetical protein [Spartobacteria bacterium]